MDNSPTTEDAIAFHFGGADAPPGWTVRSTLMALLTHARLATGRNPSTGELEEEPKTGDWLGATAYLILLDQVGKCFKPAAARNPRGPSSVERALQMWAALSRDEQCVVTALRNALVHDFALSNKNNADPAYQHRFTFDRHPTRLVEWPVERWSGDYLSQRPDTTIVSLRVLGDVVEAVVAKLKEAAHSQNVEITLPDGPTELVYRYGIMHAA